MMSPRVSEILPGEQVNPAASMVIDPSAYAGPVSSRPHWPRSLVTRAALCLALLTVCLSLLAIVGVYDISAPVRFRWQLIHRLRSADTAGELATSVGPLGVVLNHADGSWTAIAYKDAHNLGMPSVSLIRTSEGNWFESRSHHCGLFMMYNSCRRDRHIHADESDEVYWTKLDPRFALLHQIEVETDHTVRHELLHDLNFRLLSSTP